MLHPGMVLTKRVRRSEDTLRQFGRTYDEAFVRTYKPIYEARLNAQGIGIRKQNSNLTASTNHALSPRKCEWSVFGVIVVVVVTFGPFNQLIITTIVLVLVLYYSNKVIGNLLTLLL